MTRPSATCELFLDGARVPDTGVDLVSAQPTVLDGLSLTWGRDGANEQPGPATCSFTILDRFAESDFLDRLHVGSTVNLWAEGKIALEGDEQWGPNSFDYGQSTFTGWADGPPPARSTNTLNSGVTTVESEQLVITTATYGSNAGVAVPPRPYSPPGSCRTLGTTFRDQGTVSDGSYACE